MLNWKDECTHNREHRVHSISHMADEIYTPHLRTCMPSHESSFPVPLSVVLTHVLAPPGPLLPLPLVLTPLLTPLAPLLLLLVVLTHVLAPLAPLLLLLVVLTHVLTPPGLCVHWLVAQCWLIAPDSSLQDWHAFVLDKQPSFDSDQNEDSFNMMICSIITHYQMHSLI